MLEEKLERIEKRLSNDHEAVDRLQSCCKDYLGYASDEEQRKNITETNLTFDEMKADSSAKLTKSLRKLIAEFKKIQESMAGSVNKKQLKAQKESVLEKIECKNGEMFLNIESLELQLQRQVERIRGFDLAYKKNRRFKQLDDFLKLANRVRDKVEAAKKLVKDILNEEVTKKQAAKV